MFARFYVPTSRQPQFRIYVIHKQKMIVIHNGEVGNEVLWWCRWLFEPTHFYP